MNYKKLQVAYFIVLEAKTLIPLPLKDGLVNITITLKITRINVLKKNDFRMN
jgi:hypothetical protein